MTSSDYSMGIVKTKKGSKWIITDIPFLRFTRYGIGMNRIYQRDFFINFAIHLQNSFNRLVPSIGITLIIMKTGVFFSGILNFFSEEDQYIVDVNWND
jgi:hypothetical protein